MASTDVVLHNQDILPSTSNPNSVDGESMSNDADEYVINEEIPLDAKHLNRVHEELEKLNIATDVINKLELQLDEARANFRKKQAQWSQKLNELSRKYGTAIEKGRPYYEAKLKERQLREEAQNAAIRFERANSMHAVAKQQVKLTQDSLNRQTSIEPECLEVLNHHIQRVNEAERERVAAEEAHRSISERMVELGKEIAALEKANSRAIKKSRHYFEQRVEFTKILENQKSLIMKLETEVRQKKFDYTSSLRNLEQISDAIHEERSLTSMKREPGVGCESPNPPEAVRSRKAEQRAAEEEERRRRAANDSCIALEGIKIAFDEISLECDKRIDPSLFDEVAVAESTDTKASGGLGSGVILLAQQLIRNPERMYKKQKEFRLSADLTDFRYRTKLPEGVSRKTGESLPSDTSDSDSSLETTTTVNTEDLQNMLRSHSTIIKEIDECALRTECDLNAFRNDLSDADRDSGHSSG